MSPARPSRVLVCDIEGTLTDKSGRKSSPRLLARLRRLQDRGAILVLASGRGAAYLCRLRREWGLGEGPLVAENGCCVSLGGKVLPAYERPSYDRPAIMKRLRAAGVRRLAELDPAKRHAVDTQKIRSALGWAPREDFREGVRQTVLWYRNNRPWWTRLLDRQIDFARSFGGAKGPKKAPGKGRKR